MMTKKLPQYPYALKIGVKSCALSNLSIAICLIMCQPAMAQTLPAQSETPDVPVAYFDKIVITAEADEEATEATEEFITAHDISDQQIQSQHDLVRYNPEISVAEAGRYGSKGYAIRGVDGNRVAMTLDGVNLPDQQINPIFSTYGYMYEGRISPDTELLSEVRLQVGADSFNSGSGAVGGAVNYKTKDPNDLIQPGNQLGGYVSLGYGDKNEETKTAVGLAGRNDTFEALINYVYRDGHELKNHRMIAHDDDRLDPYYDFKGDPDYRFPDDVINPGLEAILPDPKNYQSYATLAKAYWHINDEHRIGVQGAYQYRQDHANNFSRNTPTSPNKRISYDENELTSYGINYRYLPMDSTLIDEIKADVRYQEVIGIADSFVYSQYNNASEPEISREYRPQYDTTTQLSLEARSLPILTPNLGEHQLSLFANAIHNDHELILQTTDKWGQRFKMIGAPVVEQDIFNIAIADDIVWSDKLRTQIGLRYDDYTYNPSMTDIGRSALEGVYEGYYVKRLQESGALDKSNAMSNLGGMLAMNYQFTPNWQTGYKLSTGFTSPSASQLYSAFEILGNRLTINPDLQPEHSLNHELSIQGDFENFDINATAFYTDYDDFINSVYYTEQEPLCYPVRGQTVCNGDRTVFFISAENIDKAKIYGLRLSGVWDLSRMFDTQGSLSLNANMSYAKDSTNEGINLLVADPFTALLGMDYESPNRDYQLHANLSFFGAKDADQAKVMNSDPGDTWDAPRIEYIAPYKFIDKSKDAFVFDVFGSMKLSDDLSVEAGVYNVFDKEYVPWSNLRTLAETSVNSMVDNDGRGIERFTAPGRNYRIGLTYNF